MTASTAAMRSRFVEDGVVSAPPPVLLVNLYDHLMLDLDRGAGAMRAGDRAVSHKNMINAQGIVSALSIALDGGDWDGANDLMNLYRYLLHEMAQANMHMDADRALVCLDLVKPLREAWYEAALSLGGTAGAAAPAAGASAPAVPPVAAPRLGDVIA